MRPIILVAVLFMAITPAAAWADCPDQIVCYYNSQPTPTFVGIISTSTCYVLGIDTYCAPWHCVGNNSTKKDWLNRCYSEFHNFYKDRFWEKVCVAFPTIKVTPPNVPEFGVTKLCGTDNTP